MSSFLKKNPVFMAALFAAVATTGIAIGGKDPVTSWLVLLTILIPSSFVVDYRIRRNNSMMTEVKNLSKDNLAMRKYLTWRALKDSGIPDKLYQVRENGWAYVATEAADGHLGLEDVRGEIIGGCLLIVRKDGTTVSPGQLKSLI